MKEYAQQSRSKSRTLESNPKASRQAPISQILQTYKTDTMGRQSIQRQSAKINKGSQQTKIVQRAIGAGDKELIGKKVISIGKKQTWVITGVHGEGSELEYHLDLSGLTQKWVKANDEDWSICEKEDAPLTEEELKIATLIESKFETNKEGIIDGYEANLVGMGDIHNSIHGAWSGGASDCVIVGCFTGSKVMMVHADRTTTAVAKSVITNAPVVYLASEVFSKGGLKAISNGNVREILNMIIEYQKDFKVFKSKQMAISPKGEIFTIFKIPESK